MEPITMRYGDQEFALCLPGEPGISLLLPRDLPSPEDEGELVRQALRQPIASPPLQDLVKPGERVAIVVGDTTRAWARYHVQVPLLLAELNGAGITDENILILSATGSHRAQTREEHIQLVGREAAARVRVLDHDCRAENLFVDYGRTRRGTPVRINRHVAEADRVVLTGGIVYHFLAGYGGGKKALLPGVADREGIMANHRLSLNPGGPGLNPDVRAGKLRGNPLSEDMVEAARKVGPVFLVNVIINDHHRIARVVAGDLVKAHEAGAALVDEYFGVPIGEKADLVVASCGGYPKDINLYQAYKTIHNMVPALKRGGVGIALMECREGVGSDLYETICTGFTCNEDREEELRQNYEIASFCGYTQFLWAQEHRLIAVSGLPKDRVERLGMLPAASLEEALEMAKRWLPPGYRAYIMPEGSTTFPLPRE